MKYKSLMRLLDVCIPKFDGDTETEVLKRTIPKPVSGTFQLPPALFKRAEGEYNVADEDEVEGGTSSSREEQFFEAEDGSLDVCALLIGSPSI